MRNRAVEQKLAHYDRTNYSAAVWLRSFCMRLVSLRLHSFCRYSYFAVTRIHESAYFTSRAFSNIIREDDVHTSQGG